MTVGSSYLVHAGHLADYTPKLNSTHQQEGPSVRACEHVCTRLHDFRNTATSSGSRAPGCA